MNRGHLPLRFFDWMPDWKVDIGGYDINIAWVGLIIGIFILSAWIVYSPCNMPLLWPSNSFLKQCQT